ncbi:hypothetical protein GO755_12010 [Spirosoma sp. HMF4905]|uniref:Uncharacterized protein n=1 Tax=Spirosoma arboris TaxID=2682092 RepID=A0A7K1SAD0_9BACT|nr:hypothetical protein [Spirosoma arboris]MVM30759.1 hypothetical protein [Spirosoma arboris]
MRTILFFWAAVLAATAAIAQSNRFEENKPQLGVSLKYNSTQNRYEVYARPNFKGSRFALGPSQISVVLPKAVADQPLTIVSKTANWADYSIVYAPQAEPDVDIHGVTTMGMLIDFEKSAQILLFSFSLPAGHVDGVRLFVNEKDPNSAQPGMLGGDFTNVIIGMDGSNSTDFFRSTLGQTSLTAAN